MEFSKMHGLGNDFIVFSGMTDDPDRDYADLACTLCDRRLGIGADGMIVAATSTTAAVRMRFYNADGSEAGMCGNGIRCFAKYVYEQGIVSQDSFPIETLAGIMRPELNRSGSKVLSVKVNMGQPGLERSQIPMVGPAGRVIDESLTMDDLTFNVTSLLMGVPHTIIFTEDIDQVDLLNLGPRLERHASFPKRTNVNWVQVINDHELKVRTWERGAGSTLACGTGSCAAVVAGVLNGRISGKTTVHLALGELLIEWAPDQLVYMTGPAVEVFVGEIDLS